MPATTELDLNFAEVLKIAMNAARQASNAVVPLPLGGVTSLTIHSGGGFDGISADNVNLDDPFMVKQARNRVKHYQHTPFLPQQVSTQKRLLQLICTCTAL
jgi:hypothetical protein